MRLFKKKSPPVIQLSESQMAELNKYPFGTHGSIELMGSRFHFHDARCFYDSWDEILRSRIYDFETTSSHPYIIDCGANMGVSVLFFARKFPNATIIGFEPEPEIYDVLQQNIQSYQLNNVTIEQKAVWDSVTTLNFFTDKGMGGSVENSFSKQEPKKVATVRLKDYLRKPVDFLKLDIEGAEYTVLKDCYEELQNVQHLFVEYHSFIRKEQHLEEILRMLKTSGFRYHLRQSFSREKPFIDGLLACENMDMAINVFAYRNEH